MTTIENMRLTINYIYSFIHLFIYLFIYSLKNVRSFKSSALAFVVGAAESSPRRRPFWVVPASCDMD